MKNTKTIVTTSMFAALICVLTMFPKMPLPYMYGYIHLGDSIIIAAAFFIGIYCVPAAAIGSCLADVFSGYFIYAPVTFALKALMAFTAFVIIKKKPDLIGFVLSAFAAELIMTAGYFVFEYFLYGIVASFGNIGFNLVQGGASIVLGVILCYAIKKWELREKYLN